MLSIDSTVNGDVNEVKLVGRLDVKAARDAETAFSDAAQAAPNILLDMTELDYIASAGLRALKRLRGDVRNNGGTLTLKGVQDDVMEVLEMTGFAAMLTFE
ncbi:MAG: STAS domain-containing protein [Eggerthellaceae bacterium]|nr:STAS domain-containing protein [Eggerthellaceae bacterium]